MTEDPWSSYVMADLPSSFSSLAVRPYRILTEGFFEATDLISSFKFRGSESPITSILSRGG